MHGRKNKKMKKGFTERKKKKTPVIGRGKKG